MNDFGMEPLYLPQAAFVEQIRADTARYARIIKEPASTLGTDSRYSG
jgi:hypothetical protein